ncbi:TRAP transporter small permease subunit [Halomonas stenophila]|uniref:TRAP transporter small permease protein n=1 Tax=Halomonas stenophila TaxID=795312 RepID=A0A7W5HLE2_9GAMM|nr:TRAP-type C4-dicarboxylate transport system permease small subunit [Halomonas stenophila]
MEKVSLKALAISRSLNLWVERLCVALVIVLVLDVWLGILARYVLPWNLTFTEELARYLMIWVALLAISTGICYRQHVGVLILFDRFPRPMRKLLALSFDVIGFAFFAFMFIYGLGYVERGFSQLTMIFGMPRGYPYIIIPVASGLACLQFVMVAIYDFFAPDPHPAAERA